MGILIHQRPQIVSGDFSTNFHPFWPCDGSLESSNPTLFNHMGTSHFYTSYSIRSCSFLSKIFLLILTGSIAGKGIKLLEMIMENSLSFDDKKKAAIVIINAIMNLMTSRQRDDEDLTEYTKHFKAARDFCIWRDI